MTFQPGDKVRREGWLKKHHVTLTRRIETKTGRTGWWGRHSDGYQVAFEDGTFQKWSPRG